MIIMRGILNSKVLNSIEDLFIALTNQFVFLFCFARTILNPKVLNSIEETWSDGPELPEVAARYFII